MIVISVFVQEIAFGHNGNEGISVEENVFFYFIDKMKSVHCTLPIFNYKYLMKVEIITILNGPIPSIFC